MWWDKIKLGSPPMGRYGGIEAGKYLMEHGRDININNLNFPDHCKFLLTFQGSRPLGCPKY
jgi:hypothetical protein